VWKRALLLVGLAALALGVWSLGLHQEVERERLREAVTAAGPWGPILFVALFSLLEAFGVPGLVFIAVAIVVWPPWQAFPLIWAGSVGAGCVGFVFARTLGRRWVAAHLPERFRRVDARLATSGLRYVIAVRVLFYLATPAHWLLGLSGVPLRTVLVGSAIGFLPGAAVWAFAGGSLFEWISAQPPTAWVAAGAAVAAFLAARGAWRRRRAAASAGSGVRTGASV
jgi:uncharacterized membrane protein YdjX (TVP38/TMEM64 family)